MLNNKKNVGQDQHLQEIKRREKMWEKLAQSKAQAGLSRAKRHAD
jgi:hypothetical protein